MSWQNNQAFPLPEASAALFSNINGTHMPHGQEVTQITEQNINFGPTLNGVNEMVNNPEVEYSSSRGTKKRKLKSKVWEELTKIIEGEKEWAVCNHCEKRFDGSSKKGTTHLNNHLKSCPSKKNPGGGAADKSADKKIRSNLSSATSSVFIKGKHLDETRLFNKNWVPPSLVQSRKASILEVFEKEKEQLKGYFEKLPCRFNLFYSRFDDYFFAGICFIDDNWELKKKVIYFNIEEDDFACSFFRRLKRMAGDLNIDKDMCSIVGLQEDEMEKWVRENGSVPSARTFLPIPSLLDDFHHFVRWGPREIRTKMRELEEYVSSNGNNKFEKAIDTAATAKSISMPINVKLTSQPHAPTHDYDEDYGDFKLVEWVVGLKETFWELVQNDHAVKPINLTEEEWDQVTVFYEFGKKMTDVANSLSDCKNVTPNVYFPKVCHFYVTLLQWEKNDTSYFREMIPNLGKQCLDAYWDKINLILAITVFLDPRFKLDIVKLWYQEIYGNNANTHIQKVIGEVTNIYNVYKAGSYTKGSTTSHNGGSNSSSHYKMLDPLGMPCTSSHPVDVIAFIQSEELERYLKDSKFPSVEEFNILAWWRVNSQIYPILGRMARDFLSISLHDDEILDSSLLEEIKDVVDSECLDFDTKEALVHTKIWLYNLENE